MGWCFLILLIMAKVEKKYEVKIYEDGKVIDHASISKQTAILIQNLLSRRSKVKKLKD